MKSANQLTHARHSILSKRKPPLREKLAHNAKRAATRGRLHGCEIKAAVRAHLSPPLPRREKRGQIRAAQRTRRFSFSSGRAAGTRSRKHARRACARAPRTGAGRRRTQSRPRRARPPPSRRSRAPAHPQPRLAVRQESNRGAPPSCCCCGSKRTATRWRRGASFSQGPPLCHVPAPVIKFRERRRFF